MQPLATAFGSAVAGMVANVAKLSNPSAVSDVANAAMWLFAVFAIAPTVAGLVALTLLCARRNSSAKEG